MIIVPRPHRIMGLRVVDVYFPDAIDTVQYDADIGVILQAANPTPDSSPFYTLKIDLSKSVEELFAEMNKTNRYEIRRAEERDSIQLAMTMKPTDDEITTYADYFDGYCAVTEGLKPCNRNRLRSLREHGGLALTQAQHENGDVLAAHANVVDPQGGRGRSLYVVSYSRQSESSESKRLIGRANRLLYWYEILRFRELGFTSYDFGGIGGANATEKQQQIAKFKLGFGGEECIEYNAVIGNTILGKTALAARKLIQICNPSVELGKYLL